MADQNQLPGKKDVARALLLKGTVFVHLDPRTPDVAVPNWLKSQPQLVLQVGLDMPIPIPDLRVDDRGVYGTLSFNRSPFTCIVPWDAVFAVVGDDGRGMVWPESMPPEIAAEVEREGQRRGAIKTVPPLRPKAERRSLEEVVGTPEEGSKGMAPPPGSPELQPARAPSLQEIERSGDESLEPPADLSARRDGDPRPRGDEGSSERPDPTDTWRPRGSKRKVKLPPYLRVVK
ncbi:MAG: ClpXP protease specificity-enhancing factor SspB [Myxococcales bacterium]|nr:ClpXP protease specificity-enhancing factor SspB [Myxococcales bacterium]MDD9970006.1 ClpXP protease specificity-enhancing factor SspB [Myxococcales bacterium]